ncbi:MAG: tRNA (guanosine(37)-N1)-methyltransferase TrmD [Gammaproteobacteria bacterium]|nr:tRNA (guanosine(37)-N1)-methyltransferase TrmD [Gammaproteobacteria bacterium]
MKFNVVTIFPEMFDALIDFGITNQAVLKQQLDIQCWNPRDFALDRHRSIDDRPYGGGPGMLMKPEPLARCLDEVKRVAAGPVVYLSPQGKRLDQSGVRSFSKLPEMTLLCGRYEGIDERLIQTRVDEEVSIGDYILAGGELGAMVIIEAVVRLIPGVLGNDLSAEQDSFSGQLLDCPHYTRPEVFESLNVPSVLLSGYHERIRRWRLDASIARTKNRRPEFLVDSNLDNEQISLLKSLELGTNVECEDE